MSTTTIETAPEGGAVDRTAAPRFMGLAAMPLWAWWAAAFALIAAKALFVALSAEPNYLDFFGDPDDAARLMEVRAFRDGAAWFDMTSDAMGGAAGLLSHWSRLIDLPLAALLALLTPVTSQNAAEIAVRTLWPLLVFAPLLWAILRTVTTAAGAAAGRVALLLALLCPLGFYQFAIGRLDHHNVMIAATVSAALLLWAYPAAERLWGLAGALLGFALTIGFEALAPVAALAVFVALWGLLDRRAARAARMFTVALMLSIAAGFLVSIPPSRWFDIRCDAIALNIVALSGVAGAGLALALSLPDRATRSHRFLVAMGFAAVGIALFGRLEPKCLAGPMGQLPAALTPVWLDYVDETRSIIADLIAGRIEQSLGLIVFFTLAVAAQMQRLRAIRTAPEVFLLAAVASFVALACWQYKYLAYASFLALAPLAWRIARIKAAAGVSAPGLQFAAAVLFSQATLLAASSKLQVALAAPPVLRNEIRIGAEACESNSALRDLAVLPPGRIAAHLDLGAYIAATTGHRVLAAPYHRIADAIITNQRIFASRDPSEAGALLAREKVDYVVICKGLDDAYLADPEWQGSLRANLVAGKAPAFLERLPLANPKSLYTVWRLRPETLNPRP